MQPTLFRDPHEQQVLGSHGPGKLPGKGRISKSGKERVQQVFCNPASKKPLAPVRNGVAPVQKRFKGGAKDSWKTFAPWVQKTFCIGLPEVAESREGFFFVIFGPFSQNERF